MKITVTTAGPVHNKKHYRHKSASLGPKHNVSKNIRLTTK
jgi:hypothetical protein